MSLLLKLSNYTHLRSLPVALGLLERVKLLHLDI